VEAFKKKYDRLHVLINNAGVSLFKRSITDDGIETIFAVNYLAPFYVTGIYKIIAAVTRPFFLSPEKGAETSIYVASSKEIEGVSGKYFAKKKEALISKEPFDDSANRKLWEVSLRLTKLPEI
jgi:NAD(P)-dependent dehydrogenase (short-subunit alcohol dehydrogenase family)